MLISTSSSASPPTSRDVPCTVGAGPGGFFGANRAIAGGGGIKFRLPSTEAAPALGSTAVGPSAGDDTAHPRCCCCPNDDGALQIAAVAAIRRHAAIA